MPHGHNSELVIVPIVPWVTIELPPSNAGGAGEGDTRLTVAAHTPMLSESETFIPKRWLMGEKEKDGERERQW